MKQMNVKMTKVKLTTNLLSFVTRSYLSILSYDKVIIHQTLSLIKKYYEWIVHVAKHEGIRQSLQLGKHARAQYLALLQGTEPKPYPFRKNIGGSFPLVKNFFNTSGGDVHLQRVFLSALSITKVIKLEPKPDIDPITRKFEGDALELANLLTFLRDNRPSFLKSKTLPKLGSIWYSNKSGPHGPSGYTAHIDARCLLDPSNHKEWIFLKSLAAKLGAWDLIKDAYGLAWAVKNVKNSLTRKLRFLPDKEGKTRNIFIGNYWTQSVLRILHKDMMKLLQSIPDDYTYSQDKAEVTILSWVEERSVITGFDLSNATERFPMIFQSEVVSMLYGNDLKDDWYHLLKNLSFNYKNCDVKFTVGQPMGYYTSWAAFSLSHHAVIYLAAKSIGCKAEGNYCLVGDDIVIKGDRLAKAYYDIIKILGVEINLFKSTKYDSGKGVVEFLKRVYSLNGEITPFPLGSFIECYTNISNIIGVQELLAKSHWSADLIQAVLPKLPIGKKELLIGAPLLSIEEGVTTNMTMGTKAPQYNLRFAGGNKGVAWQPFDDSLITKTIFMVIRDDIESTSKDFLSFAQKSLGNPDDLLRKLEKNSRNIKVMQPVPPLRTSKGVKVVHPLFKVLVDSYSQSSNSYKKYTFQKNMHPIEISVPSFKRLTTVSQDRFLPDHQQKLKTWSRILIKVYDLLKVIPVTTAS